MKTLTDEVKIIQSAGYRLTRSRLAVIQVLAEADYLLDAAAILETGRTIHPGLGKVSVYRALDLLIKLGLVRRVHGPDNCHNYGRARQAHGHYLVCSTCGQISEFACDGLQEVIETVSTRSGFTVHGHMLQLEGTCPACAARNLPPRND